MQPTWLETKLQRCLYGFTIALIGGIVGGLGVGISVGMVSESKFGLLVGGTIGLMGGIGSGIILALAVTKIEPMETLKWSWKKVQDNLMAGVRIGSLSGIIYMLGVGVLFRLVYGLSLNPVQILTFGLSGLNIGVMYILLLGLTGGDIETSTRPNQGIWLSAKNALFFALIGILTLSVVAKIVNQGFFFGATVGLVLGLFSPATVACVQHFSLRLMLTLFRYAPWNYGRFLDYGTQLIFLQKVGGGYIFIHRLLLEHFGRGIGC